MISETESVKQITTDIKKVYYAYEHSGEHGRMTL